jgi:O-antigen ligase
LLASACLFLAQLTFESKATTGTFIIFVVIFAVVIAFNRLKEVFGVVTLGLFSALIIFYLSYPDLAKALVSVFNNPLAALGDRIAIFNTGLLAGADSAFFGHGPGTFGAATSEENIRKILLGRDQVYESNLFTHRYPHAHSLYINYYVERGLIALILMIIFFSYCIFYSVKKLCESANFVAMTALVSTFVVLGIGLVNTTFHHEHGILSMLLIAPLLSQIRR